jgi:guanylate kinase
MSGRLFVISAPSGAGKSTLLLKVMEEMCGLAFSISHTTRNPRPGELDGREYYFVSREQFQKMISEGTFLEHAEVHGNFYGTSRSGIEQQLAKGYDVVLDIDVQGAAILRNDPAIDGANIFIAPPNLSELEQRLRGRGTEDEETILVRLENARKEMEEAPYYDYLLVNDDVKEAVGILSCIVTAERARGHRYPDGREITLVGQE